MLTGRWTYRSFHDEVALVGDDAQAALALIFGEGVFDLQQSADGSVAGTLDMGAGYALRISGTARQGEGPPCFDLAGEGIDGTPTAGWEYDYRGYPGPRWEQGVDQLDTLLGTVLRAKPHGPNAPAGVTAAFVAVRQPAPK